MKAPQTPNRGRSSVSLLWKSARRMKVAVAAARFDEHFEFDIAGADARAIFYHPFAHAVCRGLGFGGAVRGSRVAERSAA